MSTMPNTIWVVIPGFNEVKYLRPVLQKLTAVTTNVVFVDDGSSDDTAKLAEQYITHTLRHRVNLGKGAALKTGCEYAFTKLGAEAVIFMDSDGQHDPAELELFQKELRDGAQVVFGERNMGSEMPLMRIAGNRFASFLVYILFGAYIPDIPSGFKALTKRAYKKINWSSAGYEVELEIATKVARYKLPFVAVKIATIYHDMERGMSPVEAVLMVWKVIAWRILG